MSDSALRAIRQYYRLDDRVSTSGQPTEAQFAVIAEAGFEVIIDLAPPDGPEALPDEARIVAALGLTYIGIPVAWNSPTSADLNAFAAAMSEHRERAVWVHCIATSASRPLCTCTAC